MRHFLNLKLGVAKIGITPNYHPFNLCTGGFGDKKMHKCVMRKSWHGSDLLLATFFNLESKCNTRSWLIIHYDLKSINRFLLFLFQEIHQRDCNEPLRTRGEHDGNHTSIQDQLYQVEQISLFWKVQIFLNLNVPGSSLRLFLT